MKRFITCMLVSMMAISLYAIPAKRVQKTFTQPDGTQITLTLSGDEHYSYYLTDDGVAMQRDSTGFFREISLEQVSTIRKARLKTFEAQLPKKASITGTHKGLVILANFSDVSFKTDNSKIQAMLNNEGYSENSQSGSVHDWFYNQSNGKFSVTFDVVGPVTLGHAESYYGAPSGTAHDCKPQQMAYDAISKAKSLGYISSSNISQYDWDSDGYVDQVYIIYAGYAQSNGADENTIWPHESSLTSTISVGGKTFSTYACNSELASTAGTTMTGIGTVVHEFSHCMGLRDSYDKSGAGNYCMGYFSPMCYGCYNGTNSGTPSNYTGFERWQCGWESPVELKDATSITGMKSISDHGNFYIIYNQGNTKEYYMLENRQRTGWDAAIGSSSNAHGLLVYHLDMNKFSEGPNYTSTHPCYFIVPADKSCISLGSESGICFPQGSYYKRFPSVSGGATDDLYYANSDGTYYLNAPLTNIAEVNGLIAFDFKGGGSTPEPETEETAIDRSGWKITAYSELSAQSGNEGPASLAIDGSKTTFYHSDWSGSQTGKDMPQALLVDMGAEYTVSSFDYLGRNDDQCKGQPTSFRVYVYSDATNKPVFNGKASFDKSLLNKTSTTYSLSSPTSEGTLAWTSATQVNKYSLSTPVKGRYFLLIADNVSTQNDGNKWLCCADLNIYQKSSGGDTPTGSSFTISSYTGNINNHIWTYGDNKLFNAYFDNISSGISGLDGDNIIINTKTPAGDSYSFTHDIQMSTNYQITAYDIYYKQYGSDEAGLQSADGTQKVSVNSSNAEGHMLISGFTPASTVKFKATNNAAEYKKIAIKKIIVYYQSTPTGIEEVGDKKVVHKDGKFLENGRIIIYKNGKRYDIL